MFILEVEEMPAVWRYSQCLADSFDDKLTLSRISIDGIIIGLPGFYIRKIRLIVSPHSPFAITGKSNSTHIFVSKLNKFFLL